MDELKGKTALITGASSGIGEAAARLLCNAGAEIFLTARREEKLLALQQELTNAGGKAAYIACDIAKETSPEKIISGCIEKFGKLDILINNAGRAVNKPVSETDAAIWDEMMALNARAPFLMCKHALPCLEQSSAATVINICSNVGINTYAGQSAYGASKHALRGFTQAFSKEAFASGIRVHLLSPGGVDTDLATDVRPDLDRTILSKPEELAEIILFLLTHRNNSMIDELIIRRYSKKPWE